MKHTIRMTSFENTSSLRPRSIKMNANLPRNPDPTCHPPYQFWTCDSIHFRGCCILDACQYSGCPDSATPTTTSASSPTGQQNPSTASSAAASSTASTSPSATSSTQSASQAAATSQSSSSPSQQTSQAPQTASAAASTSTSPYRGGSQITPTSLSSQDPVTVLVTSSIFITPTSNGVTLAPTQSPVTSTSTSPASLTPSTSNIASNNGAASSGPSSKTPIIAGVVGGVGGISILALLLGLFWWRRRARMGAEEKAKHAYDNDPRLEGIDANRAGDTFGRFSGKSQKSFAALFHSVLPWIRRRMAQYQLCGMAVPDRSSLHSVMQRDLVHTPRPSSRLMPDLGPRSSLIGL